MVLLYAGIMHSPLRTTSARSVHGAGHVGGMQYFTLPHSPLNTSKSANCTAAAVYGFAKCIVHPDGTQIWRVILAFAHIPAKKGFAYSTPHPCDAPRVVMRATCGGNSAPRDNCSSHVMQPPDINGVPEFRPYALEVSILSHQAAAAYDLEVGDNAYIHTLDSGKCLKQAASVQGQPAAAIGALPRENYVLLAIPPAPHNDLWSYVLKLRTHVHWHARLGFTGHIIYLRPHHITAFYQLKEFIDLCNEHKLIVIAWTHFPQMKGFLWDAQTLRTSHAYMSLWGVDASILSIDVDEFLHIMLIDMQNPPRFLEPTYLDKVWSQCGGGAHVITLSRKLVRCSHCQDESTAWVNAPSTDSFIKNYDTVQTGTQRFGKSWGTASCTWPAGVHFHNVAHQACRVQAVSPGCAFLLHMYRGFAARPEPGSDDTTFVPFNNPTVIQ